MGILSAVTDRLSNLVANLGTPRDKAAQSFYGVPCLTEAEATNAYRGAWLPRKIVDIPAQDATRRWRAWQADADQIEKIEAEEMRLGLRAKVRDATILARLLGGAVIYIGTGDRDPSKPLDPNRLAAGGIKYLTVMSRSQCVAGPLERDPMLPRYGKPQYYELTGDAAQVRIDPSRVVVFLGAAVPDGLPIATVANGWGDSVLTAVMSAIQNADGATGNVASMMFEANVDVIRMPEFMARMAEESYRTNVLTRLSLAATAKGTNGMLLLDKDEEYTRNPINLGGVPDVMDRFMQIVSGAADIPATRLLGQAPAGMSATGESDLRNYYDRIQAMQELDMSPAMQTFDECLIRSALGSRPPEIHYTWNALWQSTTTERIANGKIIADTIAALVATKLFPEEALSVAAQNLLVENSVMPGLEGAMEEWRTETDDNPPDTPPEPAE